MTGHGGGRGREVDSPPFPSLFLRPSSVMEQLSLSLSNLTGRTARHYHYYYNSRVLPPFSTSADFISKP